MGLGLIEIVAFVGEVFDSDPYEGNSLDGDETGLSSDILGDGISC